MDKRVKKIFGDFKKLLTLVGERVVFENKDFPLATHFNKTLQPEEATRRCLIEKMLDLVNGLTFWSEKTNQVEFRKRATSTDYLLRLTENLPTHNTEEVLLEAKRINTNLFDKNGAVTQIINALSLPVNKDCKFGVATDGNAWVFIDPTGKVADTHYSLQNFEQIQSYLENKEQLPSTSPDPKLSEYQLNIFKKKYEVYFLSMLKSLKEFHKEVFITGRTCEPVKWEKEESIFITDENNQQSYTMKKILDDESVRHSIAIIGAMGTGKSVYVYQLMEMLQSRLKDTLIFFGEFTQWNKEAKTTDSINIFSNLAFQTLKHFLSDSEIREIDDEFKHAFEEYIRQKNAIIFIDGFDEFTENTTDIGKLIETLQYDHRVIVTGRDYSIRTFQASFANKKNDRLKILRLNDFTENQVHQFVRKLSIEKKVNIYDLKKWAPTGETHPELNYQNPLVLKAILRNPPENGEELSGYLILEKIATGTFEWFIGNKYNEPDFRFTWNHLNNLNPAKIKNCFFKVHQKIAIEMLNQNRNLESIDTNKIYDKPNCDKLNCNHPNCEIKRLIDAITLKERNSGFLQKYEQTYQFKPDRMFDFFITSEVEELIYKKEQLVKQILTKIIENTGLFRNTIEFLLESISKTEKKTILTKYIDEIIKSNKNLRILKRLRVPWNSWSIQTKNGKLTKLNSKDWKLFPCSKLISYLPLGVGKKIKYHFLLKSLMKLSELQELRLSQSQLSSLPESISSLKNLRELDLYKNQLSSLPKSIFSLKELRLLSLGNNALSSLPESISSLKKLRMLTLWSNRLSSLPESISSLQELKKLDLSFNELSSLPEGIGSLQNLRELELRDNKLSSLPEGLFSLKELRVLSLDGNALASLPESIGSLQNLREFELRDNKLSSLPEGLFSLKELRVLSLDGNALASLPESIGSLQELQDLDLCDNKLSSLPESIGSLQELQELKLSFQELSSLPESISSLQELQKLDLHYNKLSFLPESIGSLQELQELDLRYNKLSSLPESIDSLQELRMLSLSGNALSSLPESIFSIEKLQELYLSHIQMSSLPESISKLKNLQKLDLSKNQLSSLPENIFSIKKLQALYLGHNQLSSLSERLSSLHNLRELDLSHNKLSSLPERLSKLKNLKRLILDYNQLSSLPESVDSLHNLRELWLSVNQLSSLPERLSLRHNHRKLNLRHNKLSSLPENVKNALRKLEKNGCRIADSRLDYYLFHSYR